MMGSMIRRNIDIKLTYFMQKHTVTLGAFTIFQEMSAVLGCSNGGFDKSAIHHGVRHAVNGCQCILCSYKSHISCDTWDL